ncbi:hypothetical protein [Sediminibacterium ginsengisoli]|uniref:Uncharacterized protein n=1 Tax=Sediminibacterium ginsengisoli TaxID=413434 RepID=A0A1T4QTP8_9BACT|nr:hypothetical protein [Sediminibacterium ginsengisoli]SKA07100.1 hypothetical protein SAMN04488132_109102 [Sediminibacterium ginsengisoli]
MKTRRLFFVCCLISFSIVAGAQMALPGFTVRELNKQKTQISWINPYPSCIQLAVQRSFDSLKNFRTIFSAISPELPANGFVDTKFPPGITVYYRIFYVLKGGAYFFTDTKSPSADSYIARVPDTKVAEPQTTIRIFKKDQLMFSLEYPDYIKFRDSIISKTKDSLYTIDADSVQWRPFMAKVMWKPSQHVYTNEKGLLLIQLPELKQHHYRIVFFEEDGTELFQVKTIRESPLTLDKAAFIHAGWFHFELYEDDKLKEKNKFYLQKN